MSTQGVSGFGREMNLAAGRTARRLRSLPSRLGGGGGPLGEDVADAADFGAYAFQFFFYVLVSAVQVIDAVDDGLAVGDQRREHERGGSADAPGQASIRAQRVCASHDG